MAKWDNKIEEEIILLIKDWLKQKGKTQKDLRKSLNASSERMPSLVENLKREYISGGLPRLAKVLCDIESSWSQGSINQVYEKKINSDPFGQLDLLLEEIQEDCNT